MKTYFVGLFLLMFSGLTARAQEYTLRLTASYPDGTKIVEQAVETLVASGTVSRGADVQYKAGRAIYLESGFAVEPGGRFEAKIESVNSREPSVLSVRAYPNPVKRKTTIEYNLPRESQVTIGVYDSNGRLVRTLLQEKKTAGTHKTEWDATDVPGGTYLYSLTAEKEVKSGRIVKE
jgi:hypothetical protein